VVMKLNQKKAQKSGSRYRLEAYLAAGLGSFGLASSAEAGIVLIDLTKAGSNQVDITGVNGGAGLGAFNVVNEFFLPGNANALFVSNGALSVYGLFGANGLEFGSGGSNVSPQAFMPGAIIGGSTSTVWTLYPTVSSFKSGSEESAAFGPSTYMAMRSPVGTDFYYGWIEVTWDPNTDQFRLFSAAYEDTPNTAIKAGDTGAAPVPEPASSAVVALLMGGAALRKWRKNKNKQDAQEPSSESLAS